jgi:DNA processing protein
VVVEAARDSGSLITANLALQEGRLVYAVPGTVGEPHAEGTNALLRDGALACRGAADVLEDLAPQIVEAARDFAPASGAADGAAAAPDGSSAPALGPGHRRVLAVIPATRGIAVDALVRDSGMAPGPLLALLLDLELAGLVRQLPGRRFIAVACKT